MEVNGKKEPDSEVCTNNGADFNFIVDGLETKSSKLLLLQKMEAGW